MSVPSNPEIQRSVRRIFEKRGDNAVVEAASMADRMLERGEKVRVEKWLEILKAMDEFLTELHLNSEESGSH